MGTEREATWSFPMRFFFRYELERLIRLSNLRLEAIYGDFQGNPPTKESSDFGIACGQQNCSELTQNLPEEPRTIRYVKTIDKSDKVC